MVSVLQKLFPSRPSSVSSGPPTSLRQSHINVLHVPRSVPANPEYVARIVKDVHPFRIDANVDVNNPGPASDVILSQVPAGELHDWVRRDVADLAKIFHGEFGYQEVHARLEVVRGVLCSKWHADNVRLRCLVTYTGAGTLYLDNRDVSRRWDQQGAGSSVGSVREEGALQAAPGDWLFLKGHLWEGHNGLGAVHKSPEGAEWEPRLLLTVDDVIPVPCACCPAA